MSTLAAACRHLGVREGFEVLFRRRTGERYHFDGYSTGVEEGEAWGIRYAFEVDEGWATRSAHVVGRSASGAHEVRLEGDGSGGWSVDGAPAPHLAGCLDIDLEASAFTNSLPVNRLGLAPGQRAEAPAAWVRAVDLGVLRLEQRYARVEDDAGHRCYDYAAPDLEYSARLVYDEHGLIVDYPGLAVRVA